MKSKLFLSIISLLLASTIMIAPVAAATASGSTAVTGNPKAAVSIALNTSSVYLDLDPAAAQPIQNLTQAIIVSSNIAFSITVQDNSGRDLGQGYMGNYTPSAYQASPLNTTLAFPLSITGTANASTSAVAITPPITNASQPLYSGATKVNYQWLMPTIVSQQVTFTDAVLPANYAYRIDLQFTITSV